MIAGRHLQILSAVGRGHAVVGRAPVRHYQTVEAPILFYDLREQVMILRSVLAVDEVVRVHDRADVRLFHSGLECGQINLAHRPLVNARVRVVSVELGVVAHVVLDGRRDALRLNAADVADGDTRGEVWVFAEVLEVATVHRRAIDVHARPQEKVDALRARVAPYLRADALGQLRVPSGRERDAAGHRRGGAEVANAQRAVGHLQSRKAEARHVAYEEAVHAAEHVYLLFERHLFEYELDAPLDIGRRLRGPGRRRLRGCAQEAVDENSEGRDGGEKFTHGCRSHFGLAVGL